MKNETDFQNLTGSDSARPCWMVVDDDDGVRDFIAAVLELHGGVPVERFASGQEALAAFTENPKQFRLVVTDLEMPGMNGIELCRRLRAVAPDLKVVLATGAAAANQAGASKSGFCGLLNKPFPAADLWRLVEAAGVMQTARPAR